MFNKLLIIGAFIAAIYAQNVTIVIDSDMEANMKYHAISTAFYLLEQDLDHNTVAEKMVNELNTQYGVSWISIIGDNSSAIFIKRTPNTYLSLMFNEIKVTVFKADLGTTNDKLVNFIDIFNDAKTKQLQTLYTDNKTLSDDLEVIIKQVLSQDMTQRGCRLYHNQTINSINENCFRVITDYVTDKLEQNAHFTGTTWFVTVGDIRSYSARINTNAKVVGFDFQAGNLFIEVIKEICQ